MDRIRSAFAFLPAVLWFGALAVYSVMISLAAFEGLRDFVPLILAGAILMACWGLRLFGLIAILAFWGAWSAWNWPWYGALLFAIPGLLFIVPAIGTAILSSIFEFLRISPVGGE